MILKRGILIAYAMLSVLIFGCASSGIRQAPGTISQIREGQTTRAQVLDICGMPTTVTLTAEGKEIFVYHSVKVTSAPQNFIPFVGLIQSRMDTDTQIINVLFSKVGIVEKLTSTESKGAIKSGLITE